MKSKTILLSIIAVISIAIICVFIGKGLENRAITYEEHIENASSAIKVQEKRRFDLIPKLVECIKSYNEHEYNTLRDIIIARGGVDTDNVTAITNVINAVAEAYPELKAQKNYQDLMNELSLTENKISETRNSYNSEITIYKKFVRKFPNKQILKIVGYENKDFSRLEFEDSSVDAPDLNF